MRHSVLGKFLTVYLLFAILGFALVTCISATRSYDYFLRENANRMYAAAKDIADTLSGAGRSNQPFLYENAARNYAESLDGVVWVINSEGSFLYDSVRDAYLDKPVDFKESYFEGNYYALGRFYDRFPSRMLSVFHPVSDGGQTVGYVLIHRTTKQIFYDSAAVMDIFYYCYFIILLLSLVLLGAFLLYIYRPLKTIRQASLEYASGNFQHDLKIYTNDEIGDLAASLNYMTHQLNESEEYQKKFIANISHDFRSPLTSIKGYLGAILDGTVPQEEQKKYLQIVLTEAERLERLTNGLIDLNTWGGKSTNLIMESFEIDTVITEILETFDGISRKAKIRVRFTPRYDHYVTADKDKIRQVLYNLIDNAIKFSKSNSEVVITVYNKGDKIFCSVKDSGIGIPKEEISKIWDRFYKTDVSRNRDKTGSGIGLSIVKEIINAHNQTVDVISTEGVGTEFIFSLDRARARREK